MDSVHDKVKMTKCCVFVILQIESSAYDSRIIELVIIKGNAFCIEVMCLCSGCFYYIQLQLQWHGLLIMDLFFYEHHCYATEIILWNSQKSFPPNCPLIRTPQVKNNAGRLAGISQQHN